VGDAGGFCFRISSPYFHLFTLPKHAISSEKFQFSPPYTHLLSPNQANFTAFLTVQLDYTSGED